MKKAMIFIDGSNLFYDWQSMMNKTQKLDMGLYIDLIKEKYKTLDFIRTYYFVSASDSNSHFLQAINRIPYCEVKVGRLQRKTIDLSKCKISNSSNIPVSGFAETSIDKGTDVNIAVEMLRHAYANSYDVAILISRDADFSSVVKIIKELGKTVELILLDSRKNKAKELVECVDNITVLSVEDCSNCFLESEDTDEDIDEDNSNQNCE